MSRMMQLAMEIKGQDHATAAANLEGGDDTLGKRSNNINAMTASGKKSNKGSSLLQRFRLNSVLSSGSSNDEDK